MPEVANDSPTTPMEVSELDLRAYVRGALDGARRRSVEGFLACNPDLAARVMEQLHMGPAPPHRRRRAGPLALGLIAAVVLSSGVAAATGWTAAVRRDVDGWRGPTGQTLPRYVEDAAESREASRLREIMASQIETPQLDPVEIRKTLKLHIPKLPAAWRILDAQVYPTDDGPALNLVLEEPGGGRLTLFAVRANTLAGARPAIATRDREAVAYWERGDAAYVLSGHETAQTLLVQANLLSRSDNL